MNKILSSWLAVAVFALVALPWYQQDAGVFAFRWIGDALRGTPCAAPLFWQMLHDGMAGAWILATCLAAAGAALAVLRQRRVLGAAWIGCGVTGLIVIGWLAWGTALPTGLGAGAFLAALAFLLIATSGAALTGACRGDLFVTGAIGIVVALIAIFVFWPVGNILLDAFRNADGALRWASALPRVMSRSVWGLACLSGGRSCGVAWNTLALAIASAAGSVALGCTLALLAARSAARWVRALRSLAVLPIITPPFVLGLALILLLGRNGALTLLVADLFGVVPGRWLYGMPGVWLSQLLAFTPIAFMTLVGVVEGVGPSLEEASQTLGASHWQTFVTVSLPLMRPGLANAFLLCFIESMADFGNPIVLGGNFHVLSTEIYFSVVGAQNDPGRAAGLALVLLAFALGAFLLQNRWLGRRSYVTVSGKADSGAHAALDPRLRVGLWCVAVPWLGFTLVVYVMMLLGGFVKVWGVDNSLTLMHYADAFGIGADAGGLYWHGQAWPSFFTTLTIAAIATPLTSLVGMLTAWLLIRQRFAGKRLLEFGTLLSFAVPGTVIGIAYLLTFNAGAIQLTGTGAILVLCFVFRNMPMGLRSGIAAMRQLDASLDEASIMLRASSFTTIRRVILPLLRPALASALVYGFVRSITSVSAVIFLVSANYDMATSYIIGLVSNGNYGTAIAYASVLVIVMLFMILVVQRFVGVRRLRAHTRVQDSSRRGPVLKVKETTV
ncbi:iron ABC transporter permease [Burkholderia sp. AU33545]|uniref:ABC transporter permease n=1 Tax=Burkholderia sp. AU33545 TaxID=2879631 RepID=UPI001CF0E43F|nr:iron ABC transporter permease [Burkholderia sp. AU33545]MCA8205113.1 iron ABC transporter permease [Burkholderia sp. AU33545]